MCAVAVPEPSPKSHVYELMPISGRDADPSKSTEVPVTVETSSPAFAASGPDSPTLTDSVVAALSSPSLTTNRAVYTPDSR